MGQRSFLGVEDIYRGRRTIHELTSRGEWKWHATICLDDCVAEAAVATRLQRESRGVRRNTVQNRDYDCGLSSVHSITTSIPEIHILCITHLTCWMCWKCISYSEVSSIRMRIRCLFNRSNVWSSSILAENKYQMTLNPGCFQQPLHFQNMQAPNYQANYHVLYSIYGLLVWEFCQFPRL